MAFTLENLRSDARFLVFGDSTNTAYANTDLDRNINRHYHSTLVDILENNGDWQVNGEIATTDLVAGQNEYILPSDILSLSEVFITTNGQMVKARQRDLKTVYVNLSDYHPSVPEFDLLDNSMFIYLPESTVPNATDGIKIVYQTQLTELASTSSQPNISEPFRRILSIGAAFDYCIAQEMGNKANSLKVLLDEARQKLINYYSRRSTTKKLSLEPRQENYY